LAALACVYWNELASWLTQDGEGEPLAILDGVSVWPSVALRIVGIILAIYFVWAAQTKLRTNLTEIAQEMHLDPPDGRPLWKQAVDIAPYIANQLVGVLREGRSVNILGIAWRKLREVFDFSLDNDAREEKASLNIEAAWKAGLRQEQMWHRVARAALCAGIMFAIAIYVFVPLFGLPSAPHRGVLSSNVYWRTTYSLVILMQFLTFLVLDATVLCLLFIGRLRRAQSEWPTETINYYAKILRIKGEPIYDWIDLNFVAKRTQSIGNLIYYPFSLIALLMITRSNIFANFAPSLTIMISLGVSLSVVFTCAILLCWAARRSRDGARSRLTDGIISARGNWATGLSAGGKSVQGAGGDKSRSAEQLETLLVRIDQLKDGAFMPFTQQPLVRAVLLPVGSFGWTALVERGIIPGL
jgi:hypothetical protein